jgi:ParB family chromosome partitioning protein
VPPAAAEAQRALSDGLQTRVRIEMGKRKGKIVVDFVSLEELERVVSLILESAGPATSRVAPD